MDELTPGDLAAAFPDFGVLIHADEVVPPAITDPTARRVLTDVGLPRTLDAFTLILNPGGFRTMADIYERPLRLEVGRLFHLGVYGNSFIVLDGTSGQVLAVDESASATLLVSDLYRFAWFLYRLQLGLAEITTNRELAELEDRLIGQFSAADPEAAETLWREIIRDHIADL